MITAIRKTIKYLLQLCKVLGKASIYLACLLIGTLVLLVFSSSVMRYLVGKPLAFTDELATLLFLAGSIMTLTYGFFGNRLIRIELLWSKLPDRWKILADIAGRLAATGTFAVVTRATFLYAMDSMEYGSRTALMDMALWPWAMTIPLSLGLMTVSLGLGAIDSFLDLLCDSLLKTKISKTKESKLS